MGSGRRLGAILAVAVPLVACGGSAFDFEVSPDRSAFFKVPDDWERFNKRQMLIASGQSLNDATDQRLPWLVGYDASPNPAIDHVLNFERPPRHPVVMAQAVALDFGTRDGLSLSSIRNAIYPVDEMLENDQASILEYEELSLPDGFRGIRIEYDVISQGILPVVSGNDVIRVSQVGIHDAATETLYLFVVRCESHCYRDHDRLLSQITDSWTVKES